MASPGEADFDRGRRLGKYEILTRLTVGGMAELFLAYLPGPGGFKKFVALKQILPDVKADESFVKMFLDEARITAAFNNANIGQVFDLGEDEASGELYLAMEYISGQNLEQVVKRAAKVEAAIPVGFAARVIRDAALGLHYAHSFIEPSTGKPLPVVHRDVSPKNVMITYTGDIKVIDFGIAKARGRLNRTQVGVVKGTSGYMSPEQVKNEPLDGRTDLFAAGVMLHELLVGERLFTGPTDAAMMIAIVDAPAPSPLDVNPYVTPELNDVVLKALNKGRNDRYATGKELAKAIEQSFPEMYDEDQVAEYMGQLFEDKIAVTRSLFDLANKNEDEASLNRAVEALASDVQDGTPRPRKTSARGATPAPRSAAQATPRGGHASRNPSKPGPRGAVSSRDLPRVPAGKSVRGLPKVDSRPPRRSADDAPQKSRVRTSKSSPDLDQTLPPVARSAQRLKKVDDKPARAAPEAEAPKKKQGGGLGGLVGVLFVLVLLAGAGWAVTVGPLKGQAQSFLKQQVTEEPIPVDTGPKPIELGAEPKNGAKPQWLKEKEAQDKVLAAERARQLEIEAEMRDPENQAALEEINTKLADIYRLEDEQRNLVVAARAAGVTGAANTQRITDLQKQIDELKVLVATKQSGLKKRPAPAKNADGVEVVTDKKSAAAADIGYLSLRTINPSSVAVFQGKTSLGSTPLVKVPMDEGVHLLRVVDGESHDRTLSVKIEGGKTLNMNGVDVGSLPKK